MRTQSVRPSRLYAAIAFLATAGATCFVFAGATIVAAAREHPWDFALLLGLALALQLFSLSIGGLASMGVSAIGIVAAAALLGTGPAMAIATLAAIAQGLRRRGAAYKTVFDAGNLALAAAASGFVYRLLVPDDPGAASVFAATTVAGAAYSLVNLGLLCLIMSLAEGRRPLAMWQERFEWAWFAILVFGAIAGVAAINYQHSRLGGVLSLVLLPLLLQLGMRAQLGRTLPRKNVRPAETGRA